MAECAWTDHCVQVTEVQFAALLDDVEELVTADALETFALRIKMCRAASSRKPGASLASLTVFSRVFRDVWVCRLVADICQVSDAKDSATALFPMRGGQVFNHVRGWKLTG